MTLAMILAQAASAVEPVQNAVTNAAETTLTDPAKIKTLSIWASIWHSDPIVKIALLLLLAASVICWAVIFFKYNQLKKSQSSAQGFWQKFSGMSTLTDAQQMMPTKSGPLYEIFVSGWENLTRLKKSGKASPAYSRSYLQQRLNQAKEEELHKMEQYVSFLATTAAVAPFIGLFGTVWGILTAFMAIGQAGSSSLATVGPFIAEALVATAVGLFAAIPAVIFYNIFVGKIRVIHKVIDIFIDDFMLKSEREFGQ